VACASRNRKITAAARVCVPHKECAAAGRASGIQEP
jgi:hypothetical protein